MIIVDTTLRKRKLENNPIRVGVIGAGYMGRGLVLQIETAIPGMQVSALYNRTPSVAERAFKVHINWPEATYTLFDEMK